MPPRAATAGSATFAVSDSSPDDDFALDLEPDQQEEDRHQQVVDPDQQRLVEHDRADLQADGQLQHGLVRRRERRFAAIIASAPATTSTMPLADSSLRKSRSAVSGSNGVLGRPWRFRPSRRASVANASTLRSVATRAPRTRRPRSVRPRSSSAREASATVAPVVTTSSSSATHGRRLQRDGSAANAPRTLSDAGLAGQPDLRRGRRDGDAALRVVEFHAGAPRR